METRDFLNCKAQVYYHVSNMLHTLDLELAVYFNDLGRATQANDAVAFLRAIKRVNQRREDLKKQLDKGK